MFFRSEKDEICYWGTSTAQAFIRGTNGGAGRRGFHVERTASAISGARGVETEKCAIRRARRTSTSRECLHCSISNGDNTARQPRLLVFRTETVEPLLVSIWLDSLGAMHITANRNKMVLQSKFTRVKYDHHPRHDLLESEPR